MCRVHLQRGPIIYEWSTRTKTNTEAIDLPDIKAKWNQNQKETKCETKNKVQAWNIRVKNDPPNFFSLWLKLFDQTKIWCFFFWKAVHYFCSYFYKSCTPLKYKDCLRVIFDLEVKKSFTLLDGESEGAIFLCQNATKAFSRFLKKSTIWYVLDKTNVRQTNCQP